MIYSLSLYGLTPTLLPTLPPGIYAIITSGPLVPARSVYGFGVTPIGFTLDGWRSSRVYPFLQADFGLMKSLKPVPYALPGETSVNFLLSLGGGMKVRLGKSPALSTVYKLMHISNADRRV